jgi:DNA-binding GntR family transcriptional regulator
LIESIEQFAQKVYGIRSWSNTIPEYLQRVRQDHLDMLDALRRGRRAELVRLFRRHLAPSRDTYIHAYRQRFGTGSR